MSTLVGVIPDSPCTTVVHRRSKACSKGARAVLIIRANLPYERLAQGMDPVQVPLGHHDNPSDHLGFVLVWLQEAALGGRAMATGGSREGRMQTETFGAGSDRSLKAKANYHGVLYGVFAYTLAHRRSPPPGG